MAPRNTGSMRKYSILMLSNVASDMRRSKRFHSRLAYSLIGMKRNGEQGSRAGFTIMELVVAVSIMAILAALTIPSISRYVDDAGITSTASTLSDLAASITKFQSDISSSPFRLTQLARLVTANDTTSCSGVGSATPRTTFTAASAARWTRNGPYYTKALNVNGFPLPIGTAKDTIYRTSISTAPGFLQIQIPGVTFDDAMQLNTLVDGPGDPNQADRSNNSGAIQWSAPINNDVVVLTYNIGVGKGC